MKIKKIFCIFLSAAAVIYSIYYASLGGFKGYSGALSKIGLQHPVLFAIWGLLTCTALFYNITAALRENKFKFHYPMLAAAGVGMLLTVTFDFDYDKRMQYILHCAGSLSFSALTGITVVILFIVKKDYIFAAVSGAVLAADLIMLIIFKETAFIELTPIFAGLIMLNIHNLKKEKKAVEIK